jgi:tRNA1Val (adenine37-N6)-methyltransferase
MTIAAPSARGDGIIRAPRGRPAGWRAPGPPPAAPDPAFGPHRGEDLCFLAGDWRIFQQQRGHRWSLDDLVTAWVASTVAAARPPVSAAPRPVLSIADLGCGIGSVLMLLAWRFPDARAIGVEAQAASVDLAHRSLAWNGATARCELRHGDFRDPTVLPEHAAFDLVTGTPPYFTPGRAMASRRAQCGPCRFEERGGVEDYCAAAARLLAPGGRFVVCAAAFQQARVAAAAPAVGLAIDACVAVVPRAGKPVLFRVYAMRRASDPLAADADLPSEVVVRDRDGRWTPRFAALRTAMGMPPPVE